jgi:hypothetical protein
LMLPAHEPPTLERLGNGNWRLIFEHWADPAWNCWLLVVEAERVADPKLWSDDLDEWPTHAPIYRDVRTYEDGWLAWVQATVYLPENSVRIDAHEDGYGGWIVDFLDVGSATGDEINEAIKGRALVDWPRVANRGGGQPSAFSNNESLLAQLDPALRAIAGRRVNRITRIEVATELEISTRTLKRSMEKNGTDWKAVERRYRQLLAKPR